MNFLAPGRLWLLLAVVALAAVYVLVQLRRRHYAARFTNLDLLASVAPKRPGWRRHVAAAALLGAIVVLVAAWARPTRPEKVPRERATVACGSRESSCLGVFRQHPQAVSGRTRLVRRQRPPAGGTHRRARSRS
jgi:Aerotolerance regulator N-terminal